MKENVSSVVFWHFDWSVSERIAGLTSRSRRKEVKNITDLFLSLSIVFASNKSF